MRIICINGWSASAELLVRFTGSLSKHHEVIVLDHLYQCSPDEVREKLDSLLAVDTILMGWSLGGMLAIRYLHESIVASEAIKALVLLQTTPCFMQKSDWPLGVSSSAFQALENLVDQQKAAKLVRHFSQVMLAGSSAISEERATVKALYTEHDLPDWKVLSTGLSVLKQLDLRQSLAAVSVPIFGLYGENDALVHPQVMAYLSESCAHFEGVTLPDMGHFPFGMQAENVAKYIDDYLLTLTPKSLVHDCN